ncbi:hypothetical protein SPRG_17725 [Saprolegnia parasitica CBS 223.65]|uniref:Uncharacterized protein n=1 Tax=Saprolegnia parasitica (strain CBS 223.65) TaxID=695850 RepID=A0A067BF98_SAPPC|nr:hypothetical protein SPRG_17725 [Saprolegnia parasitica CBS 223.65]KDO16788.1 hypothetical protein SPRG_17725 [Saprolegnia parasitica CBS 223.65]|eukprot:XP_012212504.1 hypothetical protein SPRG_17725 [Saprolegnia parasitica CBS 223.65]
MVSNRMSEKMLLGWALLAETCPVDECYTPLMSTKKQAHKVYCVKCERWFSTELAAKSESPKAPEPKVEAAKVEAPWQESEAEAAAYREKKKKRDAASAKMGEKMLQGWTLLGLHCPVPECLMPLMRSREGQMYCVNCEQYVMTEEEMAAHTKTTTEQAAVSEASSAVPSPVAAPKHAPPPPPTSPLAKRRALSVPNEFDFAAMNRMAIDVLYEKMDTALGQLEAATKPKDAAEIAKLVRELAKAIKALQSLGDDA